MQICPPPGFPLRSAAGRGVRLRPLQLDPPTPATFHPRRARSALLLGLRGRRPRPRGLLGVVVSAPPRSPAGFPHDFLPLRLLGPLRYPQPPAAASGAGRRPGEAGRRGGREAGKRKRAVLWLTWICQPLEGGSGFPFPGARRPSGDRRRRHLRAWVPDPGRRRRRRRRSFPAFPGAVWRDRPVSLWGRA